MDLSVLVVFFVWLWGFWWVLFDRTVFAITAAIETLIESKFSTHSIF